jgi:hypothetical protein
LARNGRVGSSPTPGTKYLLLIKKRKMKKVMFVFAAAFMFAACGNGPASTPVSTIDTTGGVKCDTCSTDTTVVADPLPPNPPADVEPANPPTGGTITEPKPQPLPKVKVKH